MRYLYDESNSPVGLGLKYPGESLWTYFYFEKNVQGDVIGLYRSDYSSSRGYYGTLVARYSYDPYGRPVSMTNASGTTISQTAYNVAAYNPFRYRGYRYDGETGLYYLQSRYYDPETCRFIDADSYASTGQGLVGFNMFSYCNNNPINTLDVTGTFALVDDAVLLAGCFVVALVVGVVYLPPVQEVIHGVADALTDVLLDVVEAFDQTIDNVFEEFKEHTKGARNSTRGKHEEGQSRRSRDAHGEKGDARRQNRSNKRTGGRHIKKFIISTLY